MSGWSSGSHDLTPCLALGGTSLQPICLSVWCIFHICRTLIVSVLVAIIPATRLSNGGKVDLLAHNKNSINSNKVRVWPNITDCLAVVGTSLQPRCLSVVFISLQNIKLYQDYQLKNPDFSNQEWIHCQRDWTTVVLFVNVTITFITTTSLEHSYLTFKTFLQIMDW